jgi:nicotinamide mononucleotide (NMN) deamidase PncC
MTELRKKKEIKSANIAGPIVAGIAGVLAGGMAVAAAVVMSDKKNQKKVGNAWIGVKEKMTKYIDTIRSQPVIEKNTRKLADVVKVAKQKAKDK